MTGGGYSRLTPFWQWLTVALLAVAAGAVCWQHVPLHQARRSRRR